MIRNLIAAACITLLPAAGFMAAAAETERGEERQRERLVQEISDYAQALGEGPRDDVLAAMGAVERQQFVPDYQRPYAYENRPLPIGNKQTISQPTVVAMMTHLLRPQVGDKVLEVGTGSGYQAAVLARLVDHVWSVEIVEELARRSAETLADLGYDNVTVRHGDGYAGWPEQAPFDGIIVTAGAEEVPCLLYTSPSPRDRQKSRMPSSA